MDCLNIVPGSVIELGCRQVLMHDGLMVRWEETNGENVDGDAAYFAHLFIRCRCRLTIDEVLKAIKTTLRVHRPGETRSKKDKWTCG